MDINTLFGAVLALTVCAAFFGLGWLVSRATLDDAPPTVEIQVPGLHALISELRCALVRLEALTKDKQNVDAEKPDHS